MSAIASAMAGLLGLDPSAVGPANLERAARERMRALGLDSDEDYLRALRLDPEERRLACGLAIVGETWFFRDPGAFDHLGRQAQVLTRPVKVLCVPCSTGEEAYGAALTLLEAGLGPEDFLIDAFDANPDSVATARAGRFGPTSFRNPPAALSRLFEPLDDGLRQVPAKASARVRFHPGDLLAGGFGLGYGPYNMVLCRNFAMYLDQAARARLGATLAALMTPEAVLYVGHAEVTVFAALGFSPLGLPGTFACVLSDAVEKQTPPAWSLPGSLRLAPRPKRRAGLDRPFAAGPGFPDAAGSFARADAAGRELASGHAGSESARTMGSGLDGSRGSFARADASERGQVARPAWPTTAQTSHPKRDVPPAMVGAPAVLNTKLEACALPNTGDPREQAVRALADAGRLREALALAQSALDQGPPTAELFHLQAVAHLGLDQKDLAEQALRRAIYLCPGHVEALTLLELLAQARGDEAQAALLARRAQRAAAESREAKP